MDTIVQAAHHGDRPGTDRVPADLQFGAPDPRARTCSGWTRPVHHLARVQRDAPHGHAGRAAGLLPGDWLRPGPGRSSRRSATASLAGDPDRRLAWLLAIATIPAPDRRRRCSTTSIETNIRDGRARGRDPASSAPRSCGWPTDRARTDRTWTELTFAAGARRSASPRPSPSSPGISRSGISISAGLFVGLTRESAARFSFLMATPITAGAGICRGRSSWSAAGRRRRSSSVRSSSAWSPRFDLGPRSPSLPALRYLRTHALDDLRGLPGRAGRDRRRRPCLR